MRTALAAKERKERKVLSAVRFLARQRGADSLSWPLNHNSFSPSPRPSPSGRGRNAFRFVPTGTPRHFERGLTGSLSQRERAGVRENGYALAERLPDEGLPETELGLKAPLSPAPEVRLKVAGGKPGKARGTHRLARRAVCAPAGRMNPSGTSPSCAPLGRGQVGCLSGGCASPSGRGFPPATVTGPAGAVKGANLEPSRWATEQPRHFEFNPLAMNGVGLKSSLQTPYPAAKGALPRRKRCLTFSEKVANLFGKGALPFRQGCYTLWDRAGHPRRPGALGPTTWLGTAADLSAARTE